MVIDIPDIVFYSLFPGISGSSVYLLPTGHPRQRLHPAAIMLGVIAQELRQEWTGTDKAHIAHYYIEKLRQFIDPGLAKNASYTGYAKIAGLRYKAGAEVRTAGD